MTCMVIFRAKLGYRAIFLIFRCSSYFITQSVIIAVHASLLWLNVSGVYLVPVLQIRSRCLLTPGSGIIFPTAWKPFFWVKILQLFGADLGSGMETNRIRYLGTEMEKSRIRDKHLGSATLLGLFENYFSASY
jgi:hypothetical protein